MPCPARVRTSAHTTRRSQHGPIPANRLNSVPSTRPYSNAVPSTRPHSKAVPCTRPYLNAHRTPWPAVARIRTLPSSPLPRPSGRQGVLPETLDLRSTCYDATATEMLAAFVNRTPTAYPRASPPRREVAPCLSRHFPSRDCFAWIRRFCIHRFRCSSISCVVERVEKASHALAWWHSDLAIGGKATSQSWIHWRSDCATALMHEWPFHSFNHPGDRSCFPRVFLLFLSGVLFGCAVLFFYFI